MNSSFLELLREELGGYYSDLVYLDGGTDLLPRAFLPELASRIRFGTKVVAMDQSDHDVTLYCRNAGSRLGGGRRLRGAHGAVPGAAPRRSAHAVLTPQAARDPPAPLRRVGEGVPAVPAAVLGRGRRHRRRRHRHRPRGAQRVLPRPRSRHRPRRDARQLHVGRGRAAVGIVVTGRPHRAGARRRHPHPSAGARRVRGGRVEDVARRRVRRRRVRALRSRTTDVALRVDRRARRSHPLRRRARVARARVDPGRHRVRPPRRGRGPRRACEQTLLRPAPPRRRGGGWA